MPSRWHRIVRHRVSQMRLPGAREIEIVEELSQHLQDRYDELRAAGATDREAARSALAQLDEHVAGPGLETLPHLGHRMGLGLQAVPAGRAWPPDLLPGLRHSLRALGKAPGFTAVAILTLAVGIGVNAAAFSILNAIHYPELPYREPARLIALGEAYPPYGWSHALVSRPTLDDLRAQSRSFEAIAVSAQMRVSLSDESGARRVRAALVSHEMLPLLDVAPAAGHAFTADDDRPDAAPVVLLSDRLWRARYAARPDIVGTAVTVDGVARRVVGIMPAGFQFPETEDLWMPIGRHMQGLQRRDARALAPIGRLRPTATLAEALAEVRAIADRIAAAHPDTNRQWTMTAVPLPRESFEQTGSFFGLLQAAVSVVLLLVCANVGTLLLARGEERQRELAVRASLGATRAALVRQLLYEPVLLAAAGGTLGLIGSKWAVAVVPLLIPEEVPAFIHFRIDAHVVAFTAGITALAALAAGLATALRASRTDGLAVLASGTANATPSQQAGRARAALVVCQAAGATLLLSAALALTHGFLRLQRTDFGFDPRQTLVVEVPMAQPHYRDAPRARSYINRLLAEVGAVPGVAAVGGSSFGPIARDASGARLVVERTAGPTPLDEGPESFQAVTPEFARASGIRVLRGRSFTPADVAGAPAVTLVNEEAASRFWPGDDPIGWRVRFGSSLKWRIVVGVVANTTLQPLDPEVEARLYVPFDQEPSRPILLTVRTAGATGAASQAIARAAERVDPAEAIEPPQDGEARVARGLWPVRFYGVLVGAFSAFTLLLSSLGVYGVTQYTLNGRIRELAIRLALGAPALEVMRLVVRRGVLPAAIGVVLGLCAGVGLSVVMSAAVAGMTPFDPIAIGLTLAAMGTAGALAAIGPARRALRIDPAAALKIE